MIDNGMKCFVSYMREKRNGRIEAYGFNRSGFVTENPG